MKKLYQITDLEGHVVEPSALLEDICRMYKKKPHQVRAAIAGVYALDGKYLVEAIDIPISGTRDAKLLIDWNLTREEILKKGKSDGRKNMQDMQRQRRRTMQSKGNPGNR